MNDYDIYIYCKIPNNISEFSRKFLKSLFDDGCNIWIDYKILEKEAIGKIDNIFTCSKMFSRIASSLGIETKWNFLCEISLYHPQIDALSSDYEKQFKNHIIIDISYAAMNATPQSETRSLSYDETELFDEKKRFQQYCEFIRNIFINSDGVYGCYPYFSWDRQPILLPLEEDLENGTLAVWQNINLFSKEMYSKIQESFLPKRKMNRFKKIRLSNGDIELNAGIGIVGAGAGWITNLEFLVDRYNKKKSLENKEQDNNNQLISDYLTGKSTLLIEKLIPMGFPMKQFREIIIQAEDNLFKNNPLNDEKKVHPLLLGYSDNIFTYQMINYWEGINKIMEYISTKVQNIPESWTKKETANKILREWLIENIKELDIEDNYLTEHASPLLIKTLRKLGINIEK